MFLGNVIRRATWLTKDELNDKKNWSNYFMENASPSFEPTKEQKLLAEIGYLNETHFGQYAQDISLDNMLQIAHIISVNVMQGNYY